MSNPFLEPKSLLVEVERKRRERFKVSVYVGLGAMTVFLLGLLIQGCQRSESPSAASNSNAAESSAATNLTAGLQAAPTNATPTAESKPETNPPVSSAAAIPAANPPVAEPVASATPAPAGTNNTPVPTTVAAPAAEEVYVIKSGDTLGRIAKDHHTSVQAIKAANGLKTDRILAGKKLKLPPATTPAPAAPGI